MGKSKASKRKTDNSGGDLDSSTRAKRYDLKLFSILRLGLTRVGLSISFGITEISKLVSSPLRRFVANLSANPQFTSSSQFSSYASVGGLTGKSASHVTLSFQFRIFIFQTLKAGAFSSAVLLEPSIPPFYMTPPVSRFFSRKLTNCLVSCVKSTVFTFSKRSIIIYSQPAFQAIEATPCIKLCP